MCRHQNVRNHVEFFTMLDTKTNPPTEEEKATSPIKCYWGKLTMRCESCDQLLSFPGPRLDAVNKATGFHPDWKFNPIQPAVSPDGYALIFPVGDDKMVTSCTECGTFQFAELDTMFL